ncbi:MAG: 2-C-methyl-D-erythritol 4-phosphate cytidylyltransferase [Dehalococcoidia bacterium]
MSLRALRFCHSEPFACCHSEGAKRPKNLAQDKLRKESLRCSGQAPRSNLKVGAIIAAAGSSQRMGDVDKIFVPLGGKPLLAWSVDTCQRCDLVQQIVITLNNNNFELGQKLMKERAWSKATICLGGLRREDSVKEGLRQLKDSDWAIIHDGARPFLTLDLIQNGLKAAMETGAAIAAVPVKDTIKLADDAGLITETPQRDRLWTAQTPQIFRFDIITEAYKKVTNEVTDDAAAVEQLGYKVKLYMGDPNNIKVTTPQDLALAEIIAQNISPLPMPILKSRI